MRKSRVATLPQPIVPTIWANLAACTSDIKA